MRKLVHASIFRLYLYADREHRAPTAHRISCVFRNRRVAKQITADFDARPVSESTFDSNQAQDSSRTPDRVHLPRAGTKLKIKARLASK